MDLAHAEQVFNGFYLSRADTKHSGEGPRTITVGMLNDEVVAIVVWTPQDDEVRIIPMWKANEKERQRYHEQRTRAR